MRVLLSLTAIVLLTACSGCGGAPTLGWGSPKDATLGITIDTTLPPKLLGPSPEPLTLSLSAGFETTIGEEALLSIPLTLGVEAPTQPLGPEARLILGGVTCTYSLQSGTYHIQDCGQTGLSEPVDLIPYAPLRLLGVNVKAVIKYTLATP